MADAFTTSRFEVKHDAALGIYKVVVKLPEPNGPLVFGVIKEDLQELLIQLMTALGEPGRSLETRRDSQRQRALEDPSQGL